MTTHKQPKQWLTRQQISQASILYWDEGWEQQEIADALGITQGHVSQVINGKAGSREDTLAKKFVRLMINLQPDKNETLRKIKTRTVNRSRPTVKLTWRQVSELRASYFIKWSPQWELAEQYGIDRSHVSKIIIGKRWNQA